MVPRIDGACEVHDMSVADQNALMQEAALAGRALKALTGCEKINTAAIGNRVRQLHVHVIARFEGDINWPGPVWGFGTKLAYKPEAAERLIGRLIAELESEAR